MIEYRLTQLRESSPFHALIAMGLLRVAVENLGMQAASLSWRGGQASIHAPENLLDELARYAPERGAMPEYVAVGTTRKITPGRYVDLAAKMPTWMAGVATISVLTQAGDAYSTTWDMTSGRQKLLKDVGNMLTARLPPKRNWTQRIRAALIDGGQPEEGSTFGFDPEAFRSHALRAYAPSQSNMARTTPLHISSRNEAATRHVAQVWLAVEALPLHPVLRDLTGRAITSGWKGNEYHWGAWDDCLSLSAVRALVRSMVPGLQEWADRGVRAYAAPRVTSGDFGVMRMGRRVTRT